MSKKLYDLAVKTGTYKDGQGNDKGRWQNVGAVMANNDGGKFIMLAKWFNPAGVPDERGGESILLSMFEPKDNSGGGGGGGRAPAAAPRAPAPAPRAPAGDDDIPF